MKLLILILITLISSIGSLFGQEVWSLEKCMSYAVDNSYATARSANALLTARENYTAAIGRHLPQLSGGVSAATSFGRGIDPATNTYSNTTSFQNGYSINASLPIFNAFRLLNNTLYSQITKLKAQSELQKAKDDVALLVMSCYIDVLYAKGLVELNNQRVATSKEDLKRAERENSLGTKSIADVAQIEANLSSEELALITNLNQYEVKLLALKDAMNFPIDSTLTVEDKIAIQNEATEASAHEIFNTHGANLPAWDIYAKGLKAGEYSFKSAKSAYYPTISASGGISTNYFNILNGTVSQTKYANFGTQLSENFGQWAQVNMSVPIFNGMDSRTQVRKAKINFNQVQSDYNENMRKLRSSIEQAVLDLRGAEQQLSSAQKSLASYILANKAARHKWEEGLLGIIELQTSNNQLLAARVELLIAQLKYAAKCREVNYYQGTPLF